MNTADLRLLSTGIFGSKGNVAKRGRKPSNPEGRPAWAGRLARARQALGITQEDLARLIDKGSQSAVTDWERGKSEPNLAQFTKLAETLKVPPGWLAFGIGQDGLPDQSDPVAMAVVERHKHNRLFGHVFAQIAKMLVEEGLDTDLAYLVTYSQKVGSVAEGRPDNPETRELIAREVEKERLEIRTAMEEIRKSRL